MLLAPRQQLIELFESNRFAEAFRYSNVAATASGRLGYAA
jgi:hypothetical protein